MKPNTLKNKIYFFIILFLISQSCFSGTCSSSKNCLKEKLPVVAMTALKYFTSYGLAAFMATNNMYNAREEATYKLVLNTLGPMATAGAIHQSIEDIEDIEDIIRQQKDLSITPMGPFMDFMIYGVLSQRCYDWPTPDVGTAQKWSTVHQKHADFIKSPELEYAYRFPNALVAAQMFKNIFNSILNNKLNRNNRGIKITRAAVYSIIYAVFTFCFHGLGNLTIGSLAPGATFDLPPEATFDQKVNAKSAEDLNSIYNSVASQMGLVLTSSIATIDSKLLTPYILNPFLEKIWPRNEEQPETATTTPTINQKTWHKDAFNASLLPLTIAYISVFFNNSFSTDGVNAAKITGVNEWVSATSTMFLVGTGILSSIIESSPSVYRTVKRLLPCCFKPEQVQAPLDPEETEQLNEPNTKNIDLELLEVVKTPGDKNAGSNSISIPIGDSGVQLDDDLRHTL